MGREQLGLSFCFGVVYLLHLVFVLSISCMLRRMFWGGEQLGLSFGVFDSLYSSSDKTISKVEWCVHGGMQLLNLLEIDNK